MTSSEDVLLQVGQVRYKKGDGTLYLMSERLAWILDHKDTVSVSHRYADIKLQKISPEGKPKIQLQVVLHDNTTSTFQFVNREGPAVAMKERDKVKDLLVSLLPKFKKKVNKELEEKNRLLSENPGLLQLYKDLVISDVITSEEFWSTHAKPYINKDSMKQQVGVNGAFLADIKPQTDGCNGLKYNLTPDVIESVFRTYPAVRQKHLETVPNKLSESQFWTKFFQSHYFHRDRINAGSKDLFTDCAKIDDQVLSKETEQVSDPLVDISKFDDVSLGEGYGVSSDKLNSNNNIHQNMIKRFNQHSIMVLKACQNQQETTDSEANESFGNNGSMMNGNSPVKKDELPIEPPTKKKRIQEKITYEDLDADSEVLKHKTPVKLSLWKMERYLEGPIKNDWATTEQEDSSGPTVKQAAAKLREEAKAWPLHFPNSALIQPSLAVAALGELTPGGALMVQQTDNSLAQLVPKDLAKEIHSLYCTCSELLRHFWACFPTTTQELQEKAEHMHNALRRFHHARIKPFENKVMIDFSPLSQQLTSHLNHLLKNAYNKFETWQSRKKPLGLR